MAGVEFIGGIVVLSTGISDLSTHYARYGAEEVLESPETAASEVRLFYHFNIILLRLTGAVQVV